MHHDRRQRYDSRRLNEVVGRDRTPLTLMFSELLGLVNMMKVCHQEPLPSASTMASVISELL